MRISDCAAPGLSTRYSVVLKTCGTLASLCALASTTPAARQPDESGASSFLTPAASRAPTYTRRAPWGEAWSRQKCCTSATVERADALLRAMPGRPCTDRRPTRAAEDLPGDAGDAVAARLDRHQALLLLALEVGRVEARAQHDVGQQLGGRLEVLVQAASA
jgi:hypothetical protein